MTEQLKSQFHTHVLDLQDQITAEMRKLDTSLNVIDDNWERTDFEGRPGGGGRTRAFTGEVFENAGVNVSCVHGSIDPSFADKLPGDGNELWAAGISLILHPRNPRVPTVHANFRMIQHGSKVWFGGGADLTPFYPHETDFHDFHRVWREACVPYGVYDDFKQQCDDYFTNHHRLYEGTPEMRGIGGIFYDHFNSGNLEKDFEMSRGLSRSFIPSYFPIAKNRIGEDFESVDEEFQLFRRGRYVEFNLIHDRGTHFGLKTKGRVDSILISLPARCEFHYCYSPKTPQHRRMMELYRPLPWGAQ